MRLELKEARRLQGAATWREATMSDVPDLDPGFDPDLDIWTDDSNWPEDRTLVRLTWFSNLGTPDDHDHCWFCNCTIAWPGFEEGSLSTAYFHDETRTWICPACVERTQEVYRWQLKGGESGDGE